MAIPESQLSRWSNHDGQDAPKRTHEAIRQVLAAHQWPTGITYDFYLQGSYQNDTNIRGDNDVDIVLQLTSSFRHEADLLLEHDRNRLASSFQPATHDWNDFRRSALKALEARFGKNHVGQGNKTIKLKADPLRLAADIVVCIDHRKYVNYQTYVAGMAFYALHDKRWIVNYPKEHYKNGASKSSRTWDQYKRTVRMFKNVRNYLESHRAMSSSLAPSYFVECLLYNAPDPAFQSGFQDTFCSVVNWMVSADLERHVCQNGQQLLFGTSPEQWTVAEAKAFANHLVELWNTWE